MSAQPQLFPKRNLKPKAKPVQATTWDEAGMRIVDGEPELNKYGRDTRSPSERQRANKGWTPKPHNWFADIARITRGKAQLVLFDYALRLTVGRERDRGKPAPEWSDVVTYEYVAHICRCTPRNLQEDLADAKQRKLIDFRSKGKNCFQIRLLTENWEAALDYDVWFAAKKPVASDDEIHDDGEPDTEPLPVKAGEVRLWSKPVTLGPGKTRKVRIDCGVRELDLGNNLGTAVSFDPIVVGGRMVVVAQEAVRERPVSITAKNGSVKTNVSNGISKLNGSFGSGLPKHSPSVRLYPALVEGLAGPEFGYILTPAKDGPLLKLITDALGSCPLEYFLRTLYARNYHRKPVANPVLVNVAQDARTAWERDQQLEASEKQRTAPADRAREVKHAKAILSGEYEKEIAKEFPGRTDMLVTEADRDWARGVVGAP